MKYLLSILILFSGLSFSSIYLICDKPYTFYPDLKERILLDLKDSSVVISRIFFDLNTELDTYSVNIDLYEEDDFLKTTDKYYFAKAKGIKNKGKYLFWIDRNTLVLHRLLDEEWLIGEKPKCRIVSASKYSEAKKELQKRANSLTNESIKEHQEKLENRKI